MRATPLDWIQRWFLRAGLFVLPLGFAWDTVDQYVLPKLLIARVILLGLLFLFVARAALSGRVTVRRTPLDLPLLAFVVSAAISTVFAANQNLAIFGTYTRYDGLLTLITYVAVFWLSVQMLSGADEARSLLRVVLVSAYPVAVIAILQSVATRCGWVGSRPPSARWAMQTCSAPSSPWSLLSRSASSSRRRRPASESSS